MNKKKISNLQILLDLVFKASLSTLLMILVLALLLEMLLAFFFCFFFVQVPSQLCHRTIIFLFLA